MKILLRIISIFSLFSHLFLVSNSQYFSSAIRGNIPRLGKRGEFLNGINLAKPAFYANQEMNGQFIRPSMSDNAKNLDDIWTIRMNKLKNDFTTSNSLSETRRNFNDYIQVSLYNLLSNIVQYRKEHNDIE
jgi:hypothetical protein